MLAITVRQIAEGKQRGNAAWPSSEGKGDHCRGVAKARTFPHRYARGPKRACSRQPGGLLWLIQDMLSELDACLAVDQQLMVRLIAADCHGSPRAHNAVDRTRVVAKIAQFSLDPDDECPARPSGLDVELYPKVGDGMR